MQPRSGLSAVPGEAQYARRVGLSPCETHQASRQAEELTGFAGALPILRANALEPGGGHRSRAMARKRERVHREQQKLR